MSIATAGLDRLPPKSGAVRPPTGVRALFGPAKFSARNRESSSCVVGTKSSEVTASVNSRCLFDAGSFAQYSREMETMKDECGRSQIRRRRDEPDSQPTTALVW